MEAKGTMPIFTAIFLESTHRRRYIGIDSIYMGKTIYKSSSAPLSLTVYHYKYTYTYG